jgi:hypothetical protein
MRWIEFALSYNGLLALCLAMPKHYRQVFARRPGEVRLQLFSLGGWLSLKVSLATSIAMNGVVFWTRGMDRHVGFHRFGARVHVARTFLGSLHGRDWLCSLWLPSLCCSA